MSELNNIRQDQNPIFIQAEFADEVRDKAEIREAEKAALKHHNKLQLEETIDLDGNGDGRSRESQLLNIYASKAIRG
ncbi:hypothetical protein [Endozoicomonas elysicola]|uniref:Uncharacterized protein n=1 Tax=Endozoicomonas elysicola TaxID=305900 RepID=A0A081K688_9GAMM|nr:hypothetical protein [Endozoicomonas elysicola]KEI69664.1 hypothetical protein GV64_01925 [Endozoicomonas elysicola]